MNKADREAFIKEQQRKSAPPAAPAEGPRFTQAQYEAFKAESARISEESPELLAPENLNGLQTAGYDFHVEVGAQMIRDGAADVVAYLSSDRGQPDRCALLNVKDSAKKSLREYERIKDIVRRHGLYQKPVSIRDANAETDEYLTQRHRDFMHGIRRPR